jgi:hypothetical protein
MSNLEFVQGSEQHTSSWGKFYVKGLEEYQVREEHQGERHDNHHNYSGYDCVDVPEGTLFSVFEQNGDKRGTDLFIFVICITTDEVVTHREASYGNGFIRGNFREIVKINSKIKAPRLMEWWNKIPKQNLAYAEWCAECINKRGVKNLPSLRVTASLLDSKAIAKRQKLETKIAKLESELSAVREELASLSCQ